MTYYNSFSSYTDEAKKCSKCERDAVAVCRTCGTTFCLLHGSLKTTLSDKPVCSKCSNNIIRSYF